MRAIPLLLFAVVSSAAPLAAQDDSTLAFLRPAQSAQEALRAYQNKPYVPIRISEIRTAGFLTEGVAFPFGRALGAVTPPTVRTSSSTAPIMKGTKIAVIPPSGGSYAVGDTLLIAYRQVGPRGWGEIVIPTGLLAVVEVNSRQTIAKLVSVYGPIREDQVVYPAEPLAAAREVDPVATPDGPSGMVLAHRTPRELQMPGGVLFTDLGRDDGIGQGDFVQIRRRARHVVDGADRINEVLATAQVVHVGARSSTIRVIEVISPEVEPGAQVVRVATLPN